jgi:tRNA-specific 2-thiouridylase
LKFGQLYHRARELNCGWVVTGHYARIGRDPVTGRYLLQKAADPDKDQSYVLYHLTQEQLAHTRFPLGELTKPRVRAIAQEQGFVTAHKHDSQDICFVPNGKYADFIRSYTGRAYPEGDFVNGEGEVLGRHKGIICYTVGQRKGLGLALQYPAYVCRVDPAANTVTLGTEDRLFTRELAARDLNLISVPEIRGEMRVKAKVRYRQKEQWATVTQPEPDLMRVIFDQPQRAITRRQSVVLYDGDTLVGGGTITET